MPKIMSPTITSRDVVVIDLAPMSDDESMGSDNLAAMMLAMKYVRKPDDFNKVMDKMSLPYQGCKVIFRVIRLSISTTNGVMPNKN